ncbi:hypothetical protein EHS89_12535 [Amphritea balenae]|uniref:TetR/AcrR family transcriptional regulator n=2 Tax=Amphritea balenae TaxID=452629 RepID=A0A3P1SPN3_9GAMM|nr:hypothetical protein [Amphritea balenae]RRC98989.1 hypothetical protein EHS89_12535 [Amphritea balenae]
MNDAQHKLKALDASHILNTALDLAQEQDNWYDLSLVDLAARCGTSVNEIHRHFADTNAIADAWFAQALEAMLTAGDEAADNLPVKTRLEQIIWRWFEALSPYHSVTAQMLKSKLHPPHIHHWVPMIFDLSRLVQLWRDMAGLHMGGRRRQIEEIVLTGIFLVTLSAWCRDKSSQQAQSHSRLLSLLEKAEQSGQF